jgi:hypothetical protein
MGLANCGAAIASNADKIRAVIVRAPTFVRSSCQLQNLELDFCSTLGASSTVTLKKSVNYPSRALSTYPTTKTLLTIYLFHHCGNVEIVSN